MQLTAPRKESAIQKEILNYLKKAGYLAERLPLSGLKLGSGVTAKSNMSGFPDILAVCKNRRGVLLGIEVKKPETKDKDNLSDSQIKWRDKLLAAGCVHIVAYSVEQLIVELAKKDTK